MNVADRFETPGGARPDARPLDDLVGKTFPIGAFSILAGGDVFEAVNGRLPPEGPALAKSYIKTQIVLHPHGASDPDVDYVQQQILSQLQANPSLSQRLTRARPMDIDLIPPGHPLRSYGFPPTSPGAIGLFWDSPDWPRARMALRQEHLRASPQLVIHEMAHAIYHMAFTAAERELIFRILVRTWRTKAAVDEVFAIYSEREFLQTFTPEDQRAPGVYGLARQRWSEDHVFTRFVRNLYFPHKRLAGPSARSGF